MRLPGITTQWDPEEAGEALRAYLAVSLEEQSAARSPRESLATWVSAAEAKGVIVIQTSRVGTDEALGFSVHGSPYPVVAINGSDKWLRRKTFTLFHELAHLSLGTGSICDLHEKRADRDVESYCNSVAAATLLPRKAVLRSLARLGPPSPGAWSLDTLGEVAETFRVSQEATLLRLITLERADWTDWERIRPELGRLYREAAEAEQERMRASSGGPNYYVIKARDIGHGYASTVLDAYHADAISSLDVASYLGIKFQQLSAFEAVA